MNFYNFEANDNFTKFLIDSKGDVVKRYAPTVSPMKIKKDIEQLLITRI